MVLEIFEDFVRNSKQQNSILLYYTFFKNALSVKVDLDNQSGIVILTNAANCGFKMVKRTRKCRNKK